jgi:hypothetical protein
MQGPDQASIRSIHFLTVRVDDLDFDILEPWFEKGDELSNFLLETLIFTPGICSRPTKISNTINEQGLSQHPEFAVILRRLAVGTGIVQNSTPGVQHPIQIAANGCAKKSQGILTAPEVGHQGRRRLVNIVLARIPQKFHERKPHPRRFFRRALHPGSP